MSGNPHSFHDEVVITLIARFGVLRVFTASGPDCGVMVNGTSLPCISP